MPDEARVASESVQHTQASPADDPFFESYEFIDDVHGPVHLSRIERDVVDTPEFQRLFRLGQLGFVDLVYPTANHTRGAHSIGACFWAKRLIRTLNENRVKFAREYQELGRFAPAISRAEEVLISLAALLHDIPHGPFSHDIEKKTHHIYVAGPKNPPKKVKSFYGLYDKHDDFKINPALYTFLLSPEDSLLARVLRYYSARFAELLLRDRSDHLKEFRANVQQLWPGFEAEILPSLLFHILIHEKTDEAATCPTLLRTSFAGNGQSAWGLGRPDSWPALHRAWYQPFRHDIIGDTLSADLLDYLMRDQAHLGMKNEVDLKLLNYYVLVPKTVRFCDNDGPGIVDLPKYRCAIDLIDHKRGTFRAERLNDIFRLLDIRHQIHEKAVYHRVVQSAIAMLSRTALVRPSVLVDLPSLYGFGEATSALAGDDQFLTQLVSRAIPARTGGHRDHAFHSAVRQSLPCKLAERRVYRPLMVIPGDRVFHLLKEICDFRSGTEHVLRELAAVVDSRYFSKFFLLVSALMEALLRHATDSADSLLAEILSDDARLASAIKGAPKRVIFWTTPYKQLYKDPAILVCASENVTETLENLQDSEWQIAEALRSRVTAGIRDAETKNEGLWKLYVFLSDGLFYTGVLAKVMDNHSCGLDPKRHAQCLSTAQNIVVRALRSAWQFWQAQRGRVELNDGIADEDLRLLLSRFLNDASWFDRFESEITSKVSAVTVSQYLHEDGSLKCRDVRYKFDSDKAFEEILAGATENSETAALVRRAMERLGVVAERFKGEELAEIVYRFARYPAVIERWVAGDEPDSLSAHGTQLRQLWLGKLGPLGPPTQSEEEIRPAAPRKPQSKAVSISDRDGDTRTQFITACKLFITTDFGNHQAQLLEWHDANLGPLTVEKRRGLVEELQRSAAGTPRGRRRHAGDDANKLLLFLGRLVQKHTGRRG